MRLEVQRPDKELWEGVTKADLARHYVDVAGRMLPHLRDRPLTLVRAPNGIRHHRFFQKDAHHMPDELERCDVEDDLHHVLAATPEDLVRLADQACVELHGWTSRCDRMDVPDRVIFDLDPPDETMFPDVQDVARTLVALLQARGAAPYAMVTGSKGIHITVPLVRRADGDYDAVAAWAGAVAEVLTRHDPRLTTELRKAQRKGRIFVDTLRNRRRQTAVLPWSTRARPTASVATPIPLETLQDDDLRPDAWRVGHIPSGDPWKDFFEHATPLTRL